ncbi:MAG: GNAT family N-acetyltransferase [Coriobacteriia bacterium]
MEFRFASVDDAPTLGRLNLDLIRAEGHRNPMTVAELEDRMHGWLEGEYEAAMCESDGALIGYALYRRESDHVYLRQLFVREEDRRRGIATALLQWLWSNAWPDVERCRVEVLVGNSAGLAFWRAVGFSDYCVTLEVSSPQGG